MTKHAHPHKLEQSKAGSSQNEAWIAKRRPPSQDRIDSAMALLTRKGGQPPAAGDEIPESYKVWEREQQRETRRKAG